MSISSELFIAILSMDAYNRGYGAGIDGPSDVTDGEPVTIGNATISFNLDTDLSGP